MRRARYYRHSRSHSRLTLIPPLFCLQAIQGAATIKPLLLGATVELEGQESAVSGFVAFPLEDEDKAIAFDFCNWKKGQEGGAGSGFAFPVMDFVCDWLCKCNIELSTGQSYYKLWMFSPKTGKLCCSWNLPEEQLKLFD